MVIHIAEADPLLRILTFLLKRFRGHFAPEGRQYPLNLREGKRSKEGGGEGSVC